MVAVSSWAACAHAGGPNGSFAWVPGARADAALPSRPAIQWTGSTQQARWRFEASARQEPWQSDAPLTRLASRDAAIGASSRAHLAFDWQQHTPWGHVGAAAFAHRRDVGVSSAMGGGLEHLRQHDSQGTTGFSLRHLAGGFAATASFRAESLDAGASWFGSQAQRLGQPRRDQSRQSSTSMDLRHSLALLRGLEATAGTRLQSYRFEVASDLAGRSGRGSGFLASPHARVDLAIGPAARLFLAWGAEDERGARLVQDPRTRSPLGVLDPHADAVSLVAGLRATWGHGFESSVSAGRIRTRREVFLSGTDSARLVERPAARDSIRLIARWHALPGLTLDLDAAWLAARYSDGAREAVPAAARRAATAGATVRPLRGWSASLFVSHFALEGAEDEGVRLRASTLVNGRLNYNLSRTARLSFDVFNIFDQSAAPIDYYAASRLWGQPGMADDFLFHPAEPRGFRLRLRTTF